MVESGGDVSLHLEKDTKQVPGEGAELEARKAKLKKGQRPAELHSPGGENW